MYSSYSSLKEPIQREIENQKSVLSKFPENISRPITQSCSKYLSQFTSYQLPFKSETTTTTKSNQLNEQPTVASSSTSSSSNNNNEAGIKEETETNATNNETLQTASSSITTSNLNTNSSNNNNSTEDNVSNGVLIESQDSHIIHAPRTNTIQFQLESAEQVNWTLENLMYGLTLSHEYQDTIKDCWNVYHDWLSVLLDEPKPFVPQPIKEDPLLYSKKMLWHLYHLFVPRRDFNAPTKHIMMCHGVLMLIESIAKDSKLLKRDLWEDFLKFFLAINDAVLAPPFNKDDFGEVLSSRIVATLFEIWLIACNKVFPSPSLWRTFQELCSNWRHHISLVVEWNRVCVALTNRLLELLWWPEQIQPKSQSSTNDTNVSYDIQTIISLMNAETVSQSWFRFFHVIGRPIEFCDTYHASKLQEYVRVSRIHKDMDNLTTLTQFTCIKKLPGIFLEVLKGISRIVDTFLGHTVNQQNLLIYSSPNNQSLNHQKLSAAALNNLIASSNATSGGGSQPVTLEQKIRSKSVMTHSSSSNQITAAPPLELKTPTHDTFNVPLKLNYYKTDRPNVDSLLHLVGQWLFEAALKSANDNTKSENENANSLKHNREYVLGQAEAYGILCKIFCSIRTNEKILQQYLSRFYSLLLIGLKIPSNFGDLNLVTMEYECGEILASIIVNGFNLFKVDLDGINILLVPMLNALNAIFKLKYPQKEIDPKSAENKPKENLRSIFNIGSNSVTLVELKRYCIYIFSSLLSLPNHFSALNINDSSSNNFFSLRSKILEIFLAAMTNEQDTINLQILFGCGKLIVGEWSLDELAFSQKNKESTASATVVNNNNTTTSPLMSETIMNFDKKEKASYCYNQIVSLICAPLKINNATLQNHSFALSIFDSLASIAAGDILNEDESVCKIAISWIWHYVKTQIKRRSKEHTREMHSVIVAAYNCLIMLLITKPNLLRDKNTLQTVTNCIEIGISGSSSYPEQKLREDTKEGSTTLMKADKELKPASLRVKEAAECVLCFLMEHTSFANGGFENNYSARNFLDERSLIELTNKTNLNKFKYYAIDGSLILGILEKPLVKSETSSLSPTITVLLRGPFGRQAWSLHLRNSPYSDLDPLKKINLNFNLDIGTNAKYYPNRTTLKWEPSMKENKHEENGNQRDTPLKCELSVPVLSDVASKYFKNLNKFQRLKEEQIEFEQTSSERVLQENQTLKKINKNDPIANLNVRNCQDFHSARMLLTHLGYCSPNSTSKTKDESAPEMFSIDSQDVGFFEQLLNLDQLPTKTYSTSHIFYVKKNQTSTKSILNNADTILDESFYAFIHSLGTIIDVKTENKNETSPKSPSSTNLTKKLNKLNGIENVVHWSDISSEITFIMPFSASGSSSLDEPPKIKNQHIPNDIRVMIVWIEQMQDADAIHLDELLHETYDSSLTSKPKEVIIIFIHPLKSKLFRIITWSNINRKYFYTMPLTDGMVISSRMLSSMIRQTVLNIFRRKRLEVDDYQPPHVRRKNKISEIIKKFQSKKSEADMFTSLLMGH